MTYIDIKSIFRELWHGISRYRYPVLISLLAIPCLDFVALAMIRYHAVSLADCVMKVIQPSFLYFTVFAVSALWISLFSANSERPSHLLRRRRRRTVYVERIVHTCLVCLFLVLYNLFWGLFLGSFFSTSFINWGELNSIYYQSLLQLNRDATLFQVVLKAALANWLAFLAIHAMAFLADALCKNKIAGYIFMIFAAGWNTAGFFLPLITGWLSDTYMAWLFPHRFIVGFIVCPIVTLACWVTGGVLFEKKDFFGS